MRVAHPGVAHPLMRRGPHLSPNHDPYPPRPLPPTPAPPPPPRPPPPPSGERPSDPQKGLHFVRQGGCRSSGLGSEPSPHRDRDASQIIASSSSSSSTTLAAGQLRLAPPEPRPSRGDTTGARAPTRSVPTLAHPTLTLTHRGLEPIRSVVQPSPTPTLTLTLQRLPAAPYQPSPTPKPRPHPQPDPEPEPDLDPHRTPTPPPPAPPRSAGEHEPARLVEGRRGIASGFDEGVPRHSQTQHLQHLVHSQRRLVQSQLVHSQRRLAPMRQRRLERRRGHCSTGRVRTAPKATASAGRRWLPGSVSS